MPEKLSVFQLLDGNKGCWMTGCSYCIFCCGCQRPRDGGSSCVPSRLSEHAVIRPWFGLNHRRLLYALSTDRQAADGGSLWLFSGGSEKQTHDRSLNTILPLLNAFRTGFFGWTRVLPWESILISHASMNGTLGPLQVSSEAFSGPDPKWLKENACSSLNVASLPPTFFFNQLIDSHFFFQTPRCKQYNTVLFRFLFFFSRANGPCSFSASFWGPDDF